MRTYKIHYSITLGGVVEVNAASEDEACDALHDMADADLVAYADLGCGDRNILDVEINLSALEKLADAGQE